MDKQIVILGGGTAGAPAANRLRCDLAAGGTRITVIDKRDGHDDALDLALALGLAGPHALWPPDRLRTGDGVERRHAEAATVDLDRDEVFLTDGTTVGYDVLVVATGATRLPAGPGGRPRFGGAPYVNRSAGLGDVRGFVPVDPRTLRSGARRNVFAIGDARGVPGCETGPTAHIEREHLADSVRRLLADSRAARHGSLAGLAGE